jgi:hypothetical protein
MLGCGSCALYHAVEVQVQQTSLSHTNPLLCGTYASLPTARVWQLCIQQGAAWDSSQARGVCTELEYYEHLVATYKAWGRVRD